MKAVKGNDFKKKAKKTANNAIVFALVGVMSFSCLAGCSGIKKEDTTKPAVSQSQQLIPENTAKPSPEKPEKPEKAEKPSKDNTKDTAPLKKN